MIACLSRNRLVAWAWFIASLAVTIYLLWIGAKFGQRYTSPLAASLWFSVGALLYFEPQLRRYLIVPESIAFFLLALFCAFPLLIRAANLDATTIGYYGGYLLFLPIFSTALEKSASVSRATDKYLGELAYPVFLAHFMIGALVYTLTSRSLQPYGTTFAVFSAISTFAFAHLYVTHVDWRVQAIRSSFRPKEPVLA